MVPEKYKKGLWIAVISFIGNILLFLLKLWAGLVTGSVAIMADAWHTVSDSVSTIIVMISMKISAVPADEEHPYGHQRAETIAAMFIGFFLLIVAFEFGKSAIQRFIAHQKIDYGWIGIWVTGVSFVVKMAMAEVSIRQGKTLGSEALVADGWHHRSDAISSILILAGIFVNPYVWWTDSFMAFVLALYIVYIAFDIIKKAINPLMGRNVSDEEKTRILKIGRKLNQGELFIHHLHKHQYGDHTEMTFHIILPEKMTLKEASALTRKLFKKIKEETGIIATIHIDTESKYKKEGSGGNQ